MKQFSNTSNIMMQTFTSLFKGWRIAVCCIPVLSVPIVCPADRSDSLSFGDNHEVLVMDGGSFMRDTTTIEKDYFGIQLGTNVDSTVNCSWCTPIKPDNYFFKYPHNDTKIRGYQEISQIPIPNVD